MPAERTRDSKRASPKHAEGVQLTWTTPVDPSTAQSIAFAPTVTPVTFYDPPSPEDPPSTGMLFPPTDDIPSPTRARGGHAKKKPDNHIPRPPNAFILFRSSFIKNQHVSSDVETNHSTLSKIIGLTWQNLPAEERQIWHAKAKIALEEHKRKFPQYAFRPLHTKGKGAAEKRKVREVGPKDLKRCEKIAELLVEGKKGAELDAAIAEFDRHHVPQIVTRFETPITARTYRRSSSAPAPDTEHSKPVFLPSSPTMPKVRSRSTQPEPGLPERECPTPETPSESGSYSPSDFYYDSPSSPYVPSPTSSLPDVNPSFDFSTFTFGSPSSTQESAILSPQEGHGGALDSFTFGQGPLFPPCTPAVDIYDPATFAVQPPYFSSYASSPDCSMPGTPTMHIESSAPRVASIQRYDEHQYDAPFAFFDLSAYDAQITSSAMCAPMDVQTLMMPSFGGVVMSKQPAHRQQSDFVYDFDNGALSPSASSYVPTY